MQQHYTPSRLRADLYRILDSVIETGISVEIERKGHTLRIVPAESSNRLANLLPHPEYLQGDPESIVHVDWSEEWHP